jgi:hypothetical protein
MTFPQPDSRMAVLNGQEFFRLQTQLVSPGDIYESEVSALAVVVGPDSDMAKYLITYLDQEAVGITNQVIVTPDRDIIGRIDSRMDAIYPGAGARRGRILASLADLYDPSFTPTGFSAGAGDVIYYEPPNIDLLFYFKNPPSVTPQRSDRQFKYLYLTPPTVPGRSSFLVLPSFGRKSGFFTFDNLSLVDTVTVVIDGVILSPSAAPGTVASTRRPLFTQALVAGNECGFIYKSSDATGAPNPHGGLWDLFSIQLSGYSGDPMAITVTLSDDPL